ncbi:uncharacterized protein LOC105187781 [Harpegnathos saltator]|uniref:uncharacterized protein LOC105187781 n=1 Tax=Harpegnathos saltator TaxID=610380 RepID=UPI0005910993|nr:uncharacterized protein LOC105187781 [Harpegnathos saltator]
MKNKLKKESVTISKKGPIKAPKKVHSVGIIKNKVSLGRQTSSFSQVTLPPKSNSIVSLDNKVISSTPNSMILSTSNNQEDRTSKIESKFTNKKRNIPCDISPVIKPKGTNSKKLTNQCLQKYTHLNIKKRFRLVFRSTARRRENIIPYST